jgi:phosphatidylinositol kinase/protein kinase (PI-3  family)
MKFKLRSMTQTPRPGTHEVFTELALDHIRKRLNGTAEDGSSIPISQQVDKLIREAVDIRRLALMYCGWAAYL